LSNITCSCFIEGEACSNLIGGIVMNSLKTKLVIFLFILATLVILLHMNLVLASETNEISKSVPFQAYAEQLDIGEIRNSVYENKYFGFKLQVPVKWQVLNKSVSSQLYEKAKDNIVKKDNNLKSAVDSYNKPQILLWAVKYPLGTEPSPNISITAVELDSKYGIFRGKQLFEEIVKLLGNTGLNYEVIKENDEENIGGIKFDTIEINVKSDNQIIKNKYSVAILRGHALMINSAYSSEDDFRQIDSILQSIKFDRWFLIDENNIARTYIDTSSITANGEYLSCWLMVDNKGITLFHHMLIKRPCQYSYLEMLYYIDGKEHIAALVKDKWYNEDSNPSIGRNIKKCIQWAEEQGLF
jgi:hypothetical protein